MPDALEVRRACDRVVRKRTIQGLTIRSLMSELADTVDQPGSIRDIGPMLDAYKTEFRNAGELPETMRQQAIELAEQIWRAGYMAALSAPQNFPRMPAMQQRRAMPPAPVVTEGASPDLAAATSAAPSQALNEGLASAHSPIPDGPDSEQSRLPGPADARSPGESAGDFHTAPLPTSPPSTARVSSPKTKTAKLARAVEELFHRGQPDDKYIAQPLTAAQLHRLLPPEVRGTDDTHLARDLKRSGSTLIYRREDKKFWRRDRDNEIVGQQFGGRQPYVRTGSQLSRSRQQNELLYEKAIAYMKEAKRPLSNKEIADGLDIPDLKRKAFYLMLRNRLRADGRITRDAELNYLPTEQS